MTTSYDRVVYPGLPYSQTSRLIPAAYQLPEADFVGIDLSANAIERGRGLIADVRLSNTVIPGHIREMIREMLLAVVGRFESPNERLRQADAFLTMLGGVRVEADAYSEIIREEIERIHFYDPAALFHDELSEVNHAVYFREFIEHAGVFGLRLTVCDLRWQCYEAEVTLLLVDRPRLVRTPGFFPEVSRLARCQARSGPRVTTLLTRPSI